MKLSPASRPAEYGTAGLVTFVYGTLDVLGVDPETAAKIAALVGMAAPFAITVAVEKFGWFKPKSKGEVGGS